MKAILLCICIFVFGIAAIAWNRVTTVSAASPTTAPMDNGIISTPEGGYATSAPLPTEMPYSTPEPYPTYSYPPPIDPYPAPKQEMTANEFAQLIISIFGINHNGKNVQHK